MLALLHTKKLARFRHHFFGVFNDSFTECCDIQVSFVDFRIDFDAQSTFFENFEKSLEVNSSNQNLQISLEMFENS